MSENKKYCPPKCTHICPDNMDCMKYGLRLILELVMDKDTKIPENRFKREPFCQMFNKDVYKPTALERGLK